MASEPGVVVTLDGQLQDPRTPLLHADDLAAVRGDGIFESLLVRDGRPCLLEAHLGRLTQSARLMDLPEPDLAALACRGRHRGVALDGAGRRRGSAAADLQPGTRKRLAADGIRHDRRAGRQGRRGAHATEWRP